MKFQPARFAPVAGLTLALSALAQDQAAPARPNILLILADDLGYGEPGSYGQKLVPTPHLDRLAAEGMRFTQFYAGAPVCAPSRSVLMTGRHLGHTRVRGNAAAGDSTAPRNFAAQTLAAGDVTVAGVLQRAGYATGLVGKWGLGEADSTGAPWLQGFDHFFGFINQTHAHNHFPDFLWRDRGRIALPNDLVKVGTTPGTGYATRRLRYADDAFFDEAAAFIARPHGKPFFLELSLTIPHANNERARALGDGMEVPDYGSYADRGWSDRDKGHAAMNERMDRRIGELMALLEKSGLDRNTLVLFTSDNGPHREGGGDYDPEFIDSNGPLRGIKRDLTDGGIRVPMIARWPGRIKAGTVSDHVGYFGDFMATWAELAGAPVPPETDSLSLVPVLLGRGPQPQHPFLYWEFYEQVAAQAVLIEGRWKALRQPAVTGPVRLHDLKNDPGETTDVAARHSEMVARAVELMRTAHVPNEHWKLPAPAAEKPAPATKP
jgi:uncharacterized sulfatase